MFGTTTHTIIIEEEQSHQLQFKQCQHKHPMQKEGNHLAGLGVGPEDNRVGVVVMGVGALKSYQWVVVSVMAEGQVMGQILSLCLTRRHYPKVTMKTI